jgi:hypothetical protein
MTLGSSSSNVQQPGEEGSGSRHSLTVGARVADRARALAKVLLLFVLCTAAMAPIIGLQVHRNPGLTPIDELAYTDYLYKVGHGHFIIGHGESVGGDALREKACRGVARGIQNPRLQACTAALPKPAGQNTADIDPPTYYVLTFVAARVLQSFGVTHNLVTAGRLAGAAWAGSALTVIVLLCRAIGVPGPAAAVAAAAAGVTSGLVTQWQYVTPHAADLTVGGIVVLAVAVWERQRIGPWALVLAGALPPLVKASQVVIALTMAFYLLVGAVLGWEGPNRLDRRRLVGGVGVLASLAASSIVWLRIRTHYTVHTSNPFTFLDAHGFKLQYLLDNVGRFLLPWSGGVGRGLSALVVVWCYGVAAWATTDRASTPATRRLGLSALVAGALGAAVFVVSNYVLVGQYYEIPERYGFALVPLALALGATALLTRTAVVAAGVVCVLLLAALVA